MTDYANPTAPSSAPSGPSSTSSDPDVRFVEVDVDTAAYEQSHLPGRRRLELDQPAVGRHPPRHRQPRGPVRAAERVGHRARTRTSCSTATTTTGSPRGPTGSSSCTAGTKVSILNGGRKYWLDNGLPVTVDVPSLRCRPASRCRTPDFALRAFRDDILPRLGDPGLTLVDVRSPAEFNGEVIAPPGMTETAQRAGHIPGATSAPVGADGATRTARSRAPTTCAAHYGAKGVTARQGRHRLLPHR